MKRILKLLLISVLALAFVLPITACSDDNSGSKTPGLKCKKIDDVYTIYDYVAEEGVTELDLDAVLKDEATNVRIKKGAFAGNNTLVKISVPERVTKIDKGAFEQMSALETLELPFIGKTANSDAYYQESKTDTDKSVDADRTIAHLFGADEYDAGIPVTIKFNDGSNGTTTCYMPQTFKNVIVKTTSAYSIPMYAFNGAVNLVSVTLSGNIDAIGEYAFAGCKEITTISFPESVKKIYKGAFMNCSKLATLNFVSGATLDLVGEEAFVNTDLLDTALDGVITLNADLKADIFGE